MKIYAPVAIVTALAATAYAAPNPNANPWCPMRGQSCWKVKRAADALADAVKTFDGPDVSVASREADISNQPGGAAYMAKRQVDDLARVLASTTDDPEGFYSGLSISDRFARDTDAEANEKRWCPMRGQSCWKRDADGVEQDRRWCASEGNDCWKAARAAEAVMNAVRDIGELPRDASPFDGSDPTTSKRDASPEAACNAPGGACSQARRDLHAIQNAARNILEA